MRVRFRFVALIVVLIGGAGCSWGQAGFDAGRAGWSSADGSFTTDNVGSTALLWEADGATTSNGFGLTVPVMDAQRVFFVSGGSTGFGTLEGFERDGRPDCTGSPRVCQPLWRATLPFPAISDPIVSGGTVFIGGGVSPNWTIVGFDAAGVRGCAGTPLVCQPVWQATWPGGPTGAPISLMAAGGTVFATTAGLQTSGGPPSSVYAFDAAGVSECSGAAPASCTPLFSAASDVSLVYPSVAGGVLFVPRADGVGAYDAAGSTGCNGSPKVCQPLWRAATPGGVSFSAVSGGTLYAEVMQPHFSGPWIGTVYAFDATGNLGCSGNPKVCAPRMTSAAGLTRLPVVANGRVWVINGDPLPGQTLESFSADGGTGCVGPIPSCAHLSTATLPVGGATLAATKSVLFAMVTGNGLPGSGRLMAYGLDGTNCAGGTPAACTPLLSIATGANAQGLAVANGRIAMVSTSPRVNGQALFVYGLPN